MRAEIFGHAADHTGFGSAARYISGEAQSDRCHDACPCRPRGSRQGQAQASFVYWPEVQMRAQSMSAARTSRFYHRLTIPCRVKNHTLRIRVDETPEDREIGPSTKRQRFNRTEHLRQIPPDTHAGRRLKGFRQDSESQHSRFDQSYPHKRVPAYGVDAALLIYIGYAWLSNSVARAKITHALAA
jgi:hypothetical protein